MDNRTVLNPLLLKRISDIKELLNYIDVLVDGRFVEELKSYDLKFVGSKNQRVINVKETLKTGKVVIYPVWKEINIWVI